MMEPEPFNLGSSIPVPSVQELAKEPLTTVPPRYVRDLDQDHSMISDKSSDSGHRHAKSNRRRRTHGARTREAAPCLPGLGLLPAHKPWSELLLCGENEGGDSRVFQASHGREEKVLSASGEIEGLGQAFVVSEDQKLDWADLFYITTLPVLVRKPHLIPKLPSAFREAVEAYSLELKNLAMEILHQMVKALKLESEEMTDLFEEGFQGMRMNYYPPCPQPKRTIGLSPHSDSVGLTILLQVNEKEGLQIRKDGMWIPVSPLPNAFVVNVGDILEIVTNGIYRSIEHRAMVNSEKERLSIATFYNPRYDGEMGPARSLITPKTPALFRRIGVQEYYNGYFSRKLDGKSYIDVMRIQNEDGKDA